MRIGFSPTNDAKWNRDKIYDDLLLPTHSAAPIGRIENTVRRIFYFFRTGVFVTNRGALKALEQQWGKLTPIEATRRLRLLRQCFTNETTLSRIQSLARSLMQWERPVVESVESIPSPKATSSRSTVSFVSSFPCSTASHSSNLTFPSSSGPQSAKTSSTPTLAQSGVSAGGGLDRHRIAVQSPSSYPLLTGVALRALGLLPPLTSLLSGVTITLELGEMVLEIAVSQQALEDHGLPTIVQAHPDLMGIKLCDTEVKDDDLAALENLSRLKTVDLTGCSQVTEAGKQRLQEAIPSLTIVS